MKRILTLAALLLAVTAGTAQADTVWKWAGKDGKPVYGKQPPPGIKAEQVEVKAANVGKLSAPVPAAAMAAGNTVGRERAAAAGAQAPVEIGGVVVKNGSVRSAKRAEGRKGPPPEALCPPRAPICRKKGDTAPAGPPPVLPGTARGAAAKPVKTTAPQRK